MESSCNEKHAVCIRSKSGWVSWILYECFLWQLPENINAWQVYKADFAYVVHFFTLNGTKGQKKICLQRKKKTFSALQIHTYSTCSAKPGVFQHQSVNAHTAVLMAQNKVYCGKQALTLGDFPCIRKPTWSSELRTAILPSDLQEICLPGLQW